MTLNKAALKRTVLTIMIAFTILALNAQALAENAYILGATRVYAAADTSTASIKVSAGTQVELISSSGNWAKIEKNGVIGYVNADYIAAMQVFNGQTYYVKNATALYKSFGSGKKYGTMSVGTEVTLYAALDDWAMVSAHGVKGFARMDDLSATAVKAENTSSDTDTDIATGRATAYVNSEGAKVYKSYSTSSAVLGKLPVNTAVKVTAVAGDWCRVENGGYVAYMKKSDLSAEKASATDTPATNSGATTTTPPSEDIADTAPGVSTNVPSSADKASSSATPATGTAKEMDWWTSDIQSIFARGVTVTVTDVATGISWKETRYGGTNHADVQPCTAADTAAMKAACGSWSWTRRAIFVTINGVNYAASMNCMPHGSGSVSGNNFNGHHCIHFTNSRTHGSNKVCSLHQAAIKQAAAAHL